MLGGKTLAQLPEDDHAKLVQSLNHVVDQIKKYTMNSDKKTYFMLNAFLPENNELFKKSSDLSGNIMTYASPSLNSINYLPESILEAVDAFDPNLYEILPSANKIPSNAILLGGLVSLTSNLDVYCRPFVFLGFGYWNQNKKDAAERQETIQKLTNNFRLTSVQRYFHNGVFDNRWDQFKFMGNALNVIRKNIKN